MFFAKSAIGVLARKSPRVAGYRQGLSRASTCMSLFTECWVKDELCPPVYPRASEGQQVRAEHKRIRAVRTLT